MDDSESIAIEVSRRTVIEAGSTALLLAALPPAALAAGRADDTGPPPPPATLDVPVHADIPAIEAVFLDELDDRSNPLKSKGIGELGICGAGASIANAVYNACGVRIRDYPITLDKVISKMPVRT